MSNKDYRSKGQFVWTKYVFVFCSAIVAVFMTRLVVWSFGETWDWFRYMDEGGTMFASLSFAGIFQAGQNVCTFFYGSYKDRSNNLKRRLDGYSRVPDASTGNAYITYMELKDDYNAARVAATFWMVGFVVAGFIDGWTNVVQMNRNQMERGVFTTERQIGNIIFGSSLVFFEEGVAVVVSGIGHAWNDIRVIHGKTRLAWLDLFSKGATDIFTGGMGSSNTERPLIRNSNQEMFRNKPTSQPVQRHAGQNSKPVNFAVASRQEPVYHPIGEGRNQTEFPT